MRQFLRRKEKNMKKIFLIILLIFMTGLTCFASETEDSKLFTVTLKITNIKSSKGTIICSLHDSEKSFSKRLPYKTLSFKSEEPATSCKLTLAAGEYVLSIFHDTNSNGVLDSNLIGIPKEPFGFTNYDGKTPPGNFKKHKIKIAEDCDVVIPLVSF